MQRLLDSTYADARAAGCDTVQLKHDGIFSQFTCTKGNLFTRGFDLRQTTEAQMGLDPTVDCTLLGVYEPRSTMRYVFDCWAVQEGDHVVDLRAEPYRSRYVAAKIQCSLLGPVVKLVQNFPILRAPALWATLPQTTAIKGLVFRDSRAPAAAPVRVARWYAERPGELV